MRRKWVLGAVAVAATAGTALTATAVFGGGSEPRPEYATVNIELQASSPSARGQIGQRAKKPTMIYLRGPSAPVDVTPSPPGTGPYIDVRLSSCPGKSRVVEGGVFPEDTNVYQQGSYVEGNKAYHVLLGFDDEAAGGADFNLSSHLTCIKGVK